MREKRWAIQADPSAQNAVETLMRQYHIRYLTALALYRRGIMDIDRFLNPSEAYPDPFGMSGMEDAVRRIRRAEENGERITVYGDYDMDGISATAILMRYFISRGMNADYYIPDRMEEGYGLNEKALHKIASRKTSLVITVDTGITAVKEAEYAKTLGLDMIVTDHHELQKTLPDCVAIINPKNPLYSYQEQHFCGAGIAFKLVQALIGENTPDKLRPYIELACLGTVADVVKLTGENRKIVKDGLAFLQKPEVIGIEALKQSAGISDREVDEVTIGYTLAPRLNAAGRLDSAEEGVRLLLENEMDEAMALAQNLTLENQKRQQIESLIYQEALLQIEQNPSLLTKGILVLCEAYWHQGVIGIVASRLAERFSKPVILLSSDGESLKGSGRSFGSFNLFEAVSSAEDLLSNFGGHQKAAGLTLSKENYHAFLKRLEEYTTKEMNPDELVPVIEIDAEISLKGIMLEDARELLSLKPYGLGNTEPVFALMGATIQKLQKIGKEQNHLRLVLEKDGMLAEAIWFRADDFSEALLSGDKVDVAFTLGINRFRGNERMQLFVRDLRESEKRPLLPPSLETMRNIFRIVRSQTREGLYEDSLTALRMKGSQKITIRELSTVLEILEEAGVWKLEKLDKNIRISMCLETGEKVDPTKTVRYQKMLERSEQDGKNL